MGWKEREAGKEIMRVSEDKEEEKTEKRLFMD